jgi:hypothetical protein
MSEGKRRRRRRRAGGPVVYIFKTPGEAALTSNDCDGENVDEERRMVRQRSGI